MPLSIILANVQKRSKDSFAASSVVGLAVRANGEEKVKVIDARGNVYDAGFDAPTVAPTVIDDGSGTLPHNQYAGYLYVYASSKFPFVESDLATNGSLYPRSNASPATVYRYTGTGDRKVRGTVTGTTAAGIDKIWIFRTAFFASLQEAQTAAAAGIAFFFVEINNPGATTANWTDNNVVVGTDQVQSDNYTAAEFQFVVYYDPYWWGFGNLPWTGLCTWNNSGMGGIARIDTDGDQTWFSGRNGQNITFAGITTGGYDGNGTFKFLYQANNTIATVTVDGTTPVALPTSQTVPSLVTIQGPATTLYRSKPRNPFSWGFTETIGSVNVPQQYAFKVGGGLGTALAVVPNNATLKLDCEFPAKAYTLNLRAAGTSNFESTLRVISDVYSVSAHFSQFAAVTQGGDTVLWGIDYKNFAIVQSDGITQVPISGPIPKILRGLSTSRARQLLAHGVYDPRTELNCIWVSTAAALGLVNYLIYQHAPTGFWGTALEHDVLCSATIQDSVTGETKTFVGTETGFVGQAFVEGVWSNWLPDTGTFQGTIFSATATTITIASGDDPFTLDQPGIIGNWCLVTDANGKQEQVARISAAVARTLTFDLIRPLIGGIITEFNPVPINGWRFYIGMIECRLLKYFDFNMPQTDKQLMELWLTQQNSDPSIAGTLIRFYRERATTYVQFASLQNLYDAGIPSDAWFVDQDIPAELVKMFQLEIINRGYLQWRFINLVLKTRLNP